MIMYGYILNSNRNSTEGLIQDERNFEVLILFRLFKYPGFLTDIQEIKKIANTFRSIFLPLLRLISVLFLLFYAYAIIGMNLFGG